MFLQKAHWILWYIELYVEPVVLASGVMLLFSTGASSGLGLWHEDVGKHEKISGWPRDS